VSRVLVTKEMKFVRIRNNGHSACVTTRSSARIAKAIEGDSLLKNHQNFLALKIGSLLEAQARGPLAIVALVLVAVFLIVFGFVR
jgi:hypothetical protein